MSYEYKDPIISTRRGDNNEPLVPITESHKIINCKVLLSEIPNKLQGVTVTGNTVTWIQNQTGDELKVDEYRVDWNRGQVYFHPDNNGLILTFAYYGSGCQYFPASRVYTKIDGNNVIETLGELEINEITRIENENTRVSNEDTRISAEDERKINENIRLSNEDARILAENSRESNETIRNNSENTRELNESGRISNEDTRKTQEIAREQQEAIRQYNEDTRILNENERKTNETARQSSIVDIENRFTQLTTAQQQDSEVVDARTSTLKNKTYTSLNDRLEDIGFYILETKDVLAGQDTITLDTIIDNAYKLLIFDTKYGVKWNEGLHWNRNGQIITFTSVMPEDLTFEIVKVG